MSIPKFIMAGTLGCLLSSCKEKESGSDPDAREMVGPKPRATRISERYVPSRPAHRMDEQAVEKRASRIMDDTRQSSLTAQKLAEERGLECFSAIVSSFSGEKREAALSVAIISLMKRYDRATILTELDKLPPGSMKIQAISTALNAPGPALAADDRMLSAIRNLEYKEDRAAAIESLMANVPTDGSHEIQKLLSFLGEAEAFNKEQLKYRQSDLVRKYTYYLTESEGWRDQSKIRNIPEEFRKEAADQIAFSLASENEDSLVSFVNGLEAYAPEQQASAAEVGFKAAAGRAPEDVIARLDSVSPTLRIAAVSGLVQGWVRKDSLAASKWAASLGGNDQIAAAEAIVRYLKNRNSSAEELAPWQKILDQAKPE